LAVFAKEWWYFFTDVAIFALSSEEEVTEGGIDTVEDWEFRDWTPSAPLRFKIRLNKLKRHQRI
jgi:hypothetical protein